MPQTRATLAWFMTVCLIVAITLASGLILRNSVAATFGAAQALRGTRSALFAVLKGQLDEETGVRGYAATRDILFLQPYREAEAQERPAFTQLIERLHALGLEGAIVSAQDARDTNTQWLEKVAYPLTGPKPPEALKTERLGKELVDHFRVDVSAVENDLAAYNSVQRREFDKDLWLFSGLVAGTSIVLFSAGMVFVRLQRRAASLAEETQRREEDARFREERLRSAYETEKRVADTLQGAFLQRGLPNLPAINFSATYMPAAEEAKVGGDWYDASEIGANRILFTIGDIAGHGLEAAVAMSRVRNEVLSSALLDPDPTAILARVNARLLERSHENPMVTAIVGIADALRYEFTYATAGHPPPILLEPGRPPRVLEFGGVPLGVSPKSVFRKRTVQSVPGALLVLYTDGVIEHSRNVIEGERQLLEAIASISDRPEGEAATAIYRNIFEQRTVGDDVAILTIGFAPSRKIGLTVAGADGSSAFSGRLSARPSPRQGQNGELRVAS
jgi:serine phosphatase RsbU (regulator of sigma subunit)